MHTLHSSCPPCCPCQLLSMKLSNVETNPTAVLDASSFFQKERNEEHFSSIRECPSRPTCLSPFDIQYENTSLFYSSVVTSDGFLVVSGWEKNAAGDNQDFIALKLDANDGELLWTWKASCDLLFPRTIFFYMATCSDDPDLRICCSMPKPLVLV